MTSLQRMRKRAGAWLSIQRARVAHLIYPEVFVEDWTPRTIAEVLEDDELSARFEQGFYGSGARR